MRPLTVLAISGSIRRASHNRLLLAAARDQAPAGLRVDLCDLVSRLPLFNEDLEAESSLPPPVRQLRRSVAATDGLLIATPEYNQSIPGVLKNAIDWLSRSEDTLASKPVALIGATSGRWGTRLAQSVVRQTLWATGALVMPGHALYVSDVGQRFDAAGRLTDAPTCDALAAVLAAFARWIGANQALRAAA